MLEVKFAVVSISEGFDERETLSSSRRKLELILGKGLALAEAFMRKICYQRWDVHKHYPPAELHNRPISISKLCYNRKSHAEDQRSR